jgi:hypothetical protein
MKQRRSMKHKKKDCETVATEQSTVVVTFVYRRVFYCDFPMCVKAWCGDNDR